MMYGISILFFGCFIPDFIGPEAVDLVKMTFGLHLPVGAEHSAGVVVMQEGVKMMQVPLWRSYPAGCILLGIAPCTAVVLVWAIATATMLFGLSSGADLATVVGVLIEIPVMLMLVGICKRTTHWFPAKKAA